MKADQATEAAVLAALQTMADCYNRRDIEGFTAMLSPDADTFAYGTGPDEKRVGQAEIREQALRDWSQSEAGTLELGPALVSAAGNVAWVAADARFRVTILGEQLSLPGRFTGVLEQRAGRWLFAQSHFSVPAGGQEAGQSFPAAAAEA